MEKSNAVRLYIWKDNILNLTWKTKVDDQGKEVLYF